MALLGWQEQKSFNLAERELPHRCTAADTPPVLMSSPRPTHRWMREILPGEPKSNRSGEFKLWYRSVATVVLGPARNIHCICNSVPCFRQVSLFYRYASSAFRCSYRRSVLRHCASSAFRCSYRPSV
jgi:hypothetical protein